MTRKLTLILVVVALGFAGGFMAVAATASDKPDSGSLPPWVRGDGTIDRDKLPAAVPVYDANGDQVRDARGRPVEVQLDKNGSPILEDLLNQLDREGTVDLPEGGVFRYADLQPAGDLDLEVVEGEERLVQEP